MRSAPNGTTPVGTTGRANMRRRAHHVVRLVRLLASALLAGLLLALAACGTDSLVSPYTGTPTNTQRQRLQQMETRMAEIRGLEPMNETKYAVVSRGSMDRVLDEYATRFGYNPEELATVLQTQPVYELLGFIPSGADLAGLRASWFASVAAFYDPGWNTVVFAGDRLTLDRSTEVILAHEFVHALQNQHFNLYELYELATRAEGDWELSWDASFAYKALIEGDATVAMRQYEPMSPDLRDSWTGHYRPHAESTYGRLPEALQKEFAFPYLTGVSFVEALLVKGDWAAVDEAYGRPPTTTEQILHPEKYLSGEVGETGNVGDDIIFGNAVEPLRGALWSRGYGRLGEFLLRTYLEEELPETEAAIAAAGWGGDHWTLYTASGGPNKLLHLIIAWDTPAELDEFFAAYLKWLDIASDGTSQVLSADVALWHGDERSVYVSRRDGRATILISSDRGVLGEARRNLGLP